MCVFIYVFVCGIFVWCFVIVVSKPRCGLLCVCSFIVFSFGCNLLCKKKIFVVLVIFIASYKRGIGEPSLLLLKLQQHYSIKDTDSSFIINKNCVFFGRKIFPIFSCWNTFIKSRAQATTMVNANSISLPQLPTQDDAKVINKSIPPQCCHLDFLSFSMQWKTRETKWVGAHLLLVVRVTFKLTCVLITHGWSGWWIEQ
jgi:hypothetical protein